MIERLRDNYPFFHPSYAGQMLKPPHPIAALAYFLAMQINPNNHALDGGPATAKMETEVVAELARMFGYETHLGHLTSSGTIANLEALWIARSLHPDKAIAYSAESHYTHPRMCEVIGAAEVEIAVDDRGRMDLDDLRGEIEVGRNRHGGHDFGDYGLGAVDPIDEARSPAGANSTSAFMSMRPTAVFSSCSPTKTRRTREGARLASAPSPRPTAWSSTRTNMDCSLTAAAR